MYHDAIERGLESGIQAAIDIEASKVGLGNSIDVIKVATDHGLAIRLHGNGPHVAIGTSPGIEIDVQSSGPDTRRSNCDDAHPAGRAAHRVARDELVISGLSDADIIAL